MSNLRTSKLLTKRPSIIQYIPNHQLLDRSPNIGPLISRWELDKFKNCQSKSFRTSKILTLLYQQFSNLLISKRDMSGPRLGALSNNRWSGGYLFSSNAKKIYIHTFQMFSLIQIVMNCNHTLFLYPLKYRPYSAGYCLYEFRPLISTTWTFDCNEIWHIHISRCRHKSSGDNERRSRRSKSRGDDKYRRRGDLVLGFTNGQQSESDSSGGRNVMASKECPECRCSIETVVASPRSSKYSADVAAI
jgi:hypothetical protein